MASPVVVGVDGSATAMTALAWGADDAAMRDAPLRLVSAVHRPPFQIPKLAAADWDTAMQRAAYDALDEAVSMAIQRQPDIHVTAHVVRGTPVEVLCDQAKNAAELVLGSRGIGGFRGALLGSVSSHVAGHAHAPVVVVRSEQPRTFGEVVVGVDDSASCEPALGYAFEQARLREATLRAVHAWQLPAHLRGLSYDLQQVRAAQCEEVAERLAPWRGEYPQVTVADDPWNAHPVEALTEAATKADLVVVGSHGRGTLGSLLLGSVSREVLQRARCAVAVVKA